jgi:uncharacterized protein (TIGR02145 family)
MKKLFTLLAFVVTMTAMAQSVAISDDGSVADGSAILEVKSTTKGFLLPRMDKAQRDDITGAVAGLQIWCTDCGDTGAIEVNTGDGWYNKTALIMGLQAQVVDLQAQIDAMGSGTGGGDLLSVTIGDQDWTTKNLDVATYRDGTAIPEEQDPDKWAALKTGAWCYYTKGDDTTDGATYGKLYNWYAVMGITTEELDQAAPTDEELAVRKQFAPTGWHVPTDAEWATLTEFLGGESVAGGKMKEKGEAHWRSPNTAATNSSGFTALPGGYRYLSGAFSDIGNEGNWWSSTQYFNTTNAWGRNLSSVDGKVDKIYGNGANGFSVRCLRD